MCKGNSLITISNDPILSFICTLPSSVDPFGNTNDNNNTVSTNSFNISFPSVINTNKKNNRTV